MRVRGEKKRRRPLESLRPDVVAKREIYLKRIRRVPIDRLVFLDESGMNLAMSRSHAWVRRGSEFVNRVPINWGRKSLTLLGAIRLSGWVVLTTTYGPANKKSFVAWFSTKLLPKLRRGDVVVMDNLSSHHDPRIVAAATRRGVRVIYLPPYSPDLNPIEHSWFPLKQRIRKHLPLYERDLHKAMDAVLTHRSAF